MCAQRTTDVKPGCASDAHSGSEPEMAGCASKGRDRHRVALHATAVGKKYPVGLVGESKYQGAVKQARAGDMVTLAYEPDNPHDPEAIVALDRRGNRLGYIPRESFLQRIFHDEGGGVAAVVKSVAGEGKSGKLGIVLEVELDAGDNPTVSYRGGTVARADSDDDGGRPPVPWLLVGAVVLVLLLGWLIS